MRFLQKQQHWSNHECSQVWNGTTTASTDTTTNNIKNDNLDKAEDHSTCVAFSADPLFPSCGETLEGQSLSRFFTLEEICL